MSYELPIEEIRSFAELAAKQLNPVNVDKRWRVSDKYADNHWMTQIEDGEGRAISIARSQHGKRRLSISGNYLKSPLDYRYAMEQQKLIDPHITVSADKDPYQICRDIARRFLPDYLKLWEFIRERVETEKKNQNIHRQTVEELAALAGDVAEVCGVDRGCEPFVHVSGPDHAYYGDIKVNYNGETAQVDLHTVPIDIVKRILAVLPQKKEKGS